MSHFPPKYLNLNVTAPMRLAALRAKNPADWRQAREWTFQNGAAAYCTLDQGFNDSNGGKVPVWYCHTGPQFRHEVYCDEFPAARINHKGWYCDVDRDEKARGIVAMLSHGRFIAGYELSDSGERVYFGDVYDDEFDAAHSADHEAEKVAEAELEYNQRWRAANDLAQEITDAEKRVQELCILRNRMEGARDELAEVISELRTKRETLKDDFKDVEL